MWKCFDQINRPLLYAIAAKAGMPERVLGTYRRFQEGAYLATLRLWTRQVSVQLVVYSAVHHAAH